MNASCNTAVILAAGLGSRLKDRTKERPKGFLEVDGQSMIERSIGNLLNHGISKIIIGTGYLHQHFDQLKQRYAELVTFRNEDYASTGSMYTLYVLRNLIEGSFLLLESDLLYDPAALQYLLEDSYPDIILASGATQSGDEVYIQHSANGFLQNMSKNRAVLTHVNGELVGISKLSLHTLQKAVAYAEQQYREGNKGIHYEDAFVGISSSQPIKVKVVEDLAWCEIDDENHLQRALQIVYPKIKHRTKV
jgi:2-aminoethylphosphonate-pyruvate transaminase